MNLKDTTNELRNVHDRLDSIGIESRDLRNKIRGIIKSLNKEIDNEESTDRRRIKNI